MRFQNVITKLALTVVSLLIIATAGCGVNEALAQKEREAHQVLSDRGFARVEIVTENPTGPEDSVSATAFIGACGPIDLYVKDGQVGRAGLGTDLTAKDVAIAEFSSFCQPPKA